MKVLEKVSGSDRSERAASPQLPRTVCCWPAEKDIWEPHPYLWSVKWNLARSPLKWCWIVTISNMISRDIMLRVGQTPIKSRFHIKYEDKVQTMRVVYWTYWQFKVTFIRTLEGAGFHWFHSVILTAQHVERNTGGGTVADSPVSYQDSLECS